MAVMEPITLTRRCTILARVETGGTGRYGGKVLEDAPVDAVCELQQHPSATGRGEPPDQGQLSESAWLFIFPAGTVLGSGDAVVDQLEGHQYEIVGESWKVVDPWEKAEHHVEARAKRTAGPGAAS